ncbi:MAG: response regulator transcription factor [Myxococcota bacterium]
MTERKKHILVIEDDESVRNLLLHALSLTYEVEAISDGNTAFRRVQSEPVADLMICDVMLPGVDGWAIARRAKTSKWAQVPIIFLTAKTTPRDVIQGIQSGARHYVTKPFKLKDLLDKVKKIVGA